MGAGCVNTPRLFDALYFTGERKVEVRQETLAKLQAGQVLVAAECSAISAGSELLIYSNQMPNVPEDAGIDPVSHSLEYPLRYGYCMVGRVIEVGEDVSPDWIGQRVFAFQPHGSHFIAAVDELLPVPADISAEDAVFLANTETAVNLVMDGAPALGEQVVVLGLGVVGLLTTALLAEFPLAQLLAFDRLAERRAAGLAVGAQQSGDPGNPADVTALKELLKRNDYVGADLLYELSGVPAALNLAIELAGYNSRIIAGSWYGQRQAALDLGGRFHRQRMQIISSQVSTVAPEFSGRWSKARRFSQAWEAIRKIRPSRFITQRYSLFEAAKAYELLDKRPGEALQVVFEYPDATS